MELPLLGVGELHTSAAQGCHSGRDSAEADELLAGWSTIPLWAREIPLWSLQARLIFNIRQWVVTNTIRRLNLRATRL
jgi:hypothetical protein